MSHRIGGVKRAPSKIFGGLCEITAVRTRSPPFAWRYGPTVSLMKGLISAATAAGSSHAGLCP